MSLLGDGGTVKDAAEEQPGVRGEEWMPLARSPGRLPPPSRTLSEPPRQGLLGAAPCGPVMSSVSRSFPSCSPVLWGSSGFLKMTPLP